MRPRKWHWVLIVGITLGILLWGGLHTTLEATNSERFCLSCHEMREYIYPEYIQSTHHLNRTGVRATCADCHVPQPWGYMIIRKIGATNELYHKVIGTISTREKFIARRLQLAQWVWQDMRASDSRECRNCHTWTAMDLKQQTERALNKHRRAVSEGLTCIDCHMGITHQIPNDFDQSGELHETYAREGRACDDCHRGLAWEK